MASNNEEVPLTTELEKLHLEQKSSSQSVENVSLKDSAASHSDLDFVSITKKISSTDSAVIHSEMEFDPENTPRDPDPEGTRVSFSSEDVISEQTKGSVIPVISLDTIPVEILLHICSFLEAGVIIDTLSHVCQKFCDLFCNESYWRIRMVKRWPKKYPPVDYDEMDWQHSCVERERSHRVWSDPEQHTEHFKFTDNLFAAVDVVHLMQDGRLLAAGSRDRYLTLLDLSKYDSCRPETKKDMQLHCINKAHNGWIWSMASHNNHLYTGSWDTKIKVWDLAQDFTVSTSYKCKSAVLSIYVEDNFIVAGCFDKKVYFIDPREGRITSTKRWHRQPVLCIAADDNFIISGSEDKTFSVYDRRAGLVFKSVQVENYPMAVSYHSNQLWFGDRMGHLNLLDTTMGKFELAGNYDVGHKYKMTGVIHTEGAIYTSSNDQTVKVLEPSLDPQTITTLEKHDSGVAGVAYQNGILASAGCDNTVGIWRPKKDWGWSS
ncbi:F-box/WD repeat-containing protein 9-like [Babylonia areolata]|uniref:F-box/WD repeat-containing protein 9-like n=1 Tax=Babylonia areolata TaxID=304850 RepID=UPI003FD6B0E3